MAKIPPIPKVVNVLHYPFRIITRKRGTDLWENEWGYIDQEKLVIYINSDAPLITQWRTLWHELIHALEFAFGFELLENDTISIPDLLATGILYLISDNPDLYPCGKTTASKTR